MEDTKVSKAKYNAVHNKQSAYQRIRSVQKWDHNTGWTSSLLRMCDTCINISFKCLFTGWRFECNIISEDEYDEVQKNPPAYERVRSIRKWDQNIHLPVLAPGWRFEDTIVSKADCNVVRNDLPAYNLRESPVGTKMGSQGWLADAMGLSIQ